MNLNEHGVLRDAEHGLSHPLDPSIGGSGFNHRADVTYTRPELAAKMAASSYRELLAFNGDQVVNAAEVWYIIARETSAAEADASIKLLGNIGIEFIELIGTLRLLRLSSNRG